MGRNAKYLEDQDEGGPSSRWTRWFGLVPLLPAIALVIIVALVATALSTRVVALNFTGGAPSVGAVNGSELGGQPIPTNSGGPEVAFTTRQVSPAQFTGSVRITNDTGAALPTWRMTLRFTGANVVRARRARVIRLGAVLVVHSNAPLAAGASVVVTYTADGTAADPTSCSLNARTCRIV